MYEFKLPDIGEGVAEAEVVAWLVREGDLVQEDQPIVEVVTDKATLEIPSPRAGRVHRLCCREGEVIAVGHVLVEIDDGDSQRDAPAESRAGREAAPAQAAPNQSADLGEALEEVVAGAHVAPPEAGKPAPSARAAGEPPGETPEALEERKHPPRMPPRPLARPRATTPYGRKPAEAVPAVRELAKRLGLDIDQIPGTGPEGRVMRRDVELFYEKMRTGGSPPSTAHLSIAGPATPDEADWTRQPLRPVRRRIAERMVQSKTLVPHYTYVEEVDMTVLEEQRKRLADTSLRDEISPLAFIAHATVRVLPRYPQLNACMDEQTGEVIYKGKIHLGIAVATEEGLMVPVIRNAAGREVVELAAMIRDLSDRARHKKLSPSELQGSTFTITSLGKLGGVMSTPIINYPASAILGVHAIRALPRYVGNRVQPRKILNLSISLDHRIVDGFEGARFIQDVKDILEQADFPEFQQGGKS